MGNIKKIHENEISLTIAGCSMLLYRPFLESTRGKPKKGENVSFRRSIIASHEKLCNLGKSGISQGCGLCFGLLMVS